MLPKRSRLTRADFAELAKQKPVILRSDLFRISLYPSKTGISVIISKKTAKLATKRNLLRRQLLTCLKSIQNNELKNQAALVLVPQKAAVTVPYAQLCSELQSLVQQYRPR